MRGLGGGRVRLAVEPDHHISEQQCDEDHDDGDHDEQIIVEALDVFHDRRHGFLKAHLARHRNAGRMCACGCEK